MVEQNRHALACGRLSGAKPHANAWRFCSGSAIMEVQSRIRNVCLLFVVVPGLAFAQYGNPYGYPRSTRRTAGPNNGVPNGVTPLVTMRGALRLIDKKRIAIDASEDQILTFKRSKKTRFLNGTKEIKPDDFPDGASVVIEASRAMNGDYDAVNVFLGEPPAPAKPASPPDDHSSESVSKAR